MRQPPERARGWINLDLPGLPGRPSRFAQIPAGGAGHGAATIGVYRGSGGHAANILPALWDNDVERADGENMTADRNDIRLALPSPSCGRRNPSPLTLTASGTKVCQVIT